VKEVQFWHPHHSTFGHLEEAAGNGCQICSTLLVRIKAQYLGLPTKDAFNFNASPTNATIHDHVQCDQIEQGYEEEFIHGADMSTVLEGPLPTKKTYRL
jgi:hypothetical protein